MADPQDEDDAEEPELTPEQKEAVDLHKAMEKLLANHVAALMEHCDSVQIIVTANTQKFKGTIAHSAGGGNWYARKASVLDWLNANSH